MANTASKEKRTISPSTMKAVMEFAPRDGFKLTDALLNTMYRVIDVNEVEFGTNKSFMMTLEDDKGNIVNLSASALKKARALGVSDAKGEVFGDNENIFTRSKADEIWNGSSYYHSGDKGMKKGEEFIVPEQIKLRYAILAEDQETESPALNPFLYKGFRKVVDFYNKTDSFPTMDDFKEELLKSVEDGRIAGLPISMKTPEKQNWVKDNDVANFRHTLIVSDFE